MTFSITYTVKEPDKYIQFRFPRSKKKRIRRKWEKNSANWKTVIGKNQTLHIPNAICTGVSDNGRTMNFSAIPQYECDCLYLLN